MGGFSFPFAVRVVCSGDIIRDGGLKPPFLSGKPLSKFSEHAIFPFRLGSVHFFDWEASISW
jgi:hypothetical protein